MIFIEQALEALVMGERKLSNHSIGYNFKREEEEYVFEQRLLADGLGHGGSSDDKRSLSLCRYIHNMISTDNFEQRDECLKMAQNHVCQLLLSADRHEKAFRMYDRTFDQLEKMMEQKRVELAKYGTELEKLRLDLEFVEKFGEVQKYTDRPTNELKMRELDTRKKELEQKIMKQREELQRISKACRDLQSILDEEENNKHSNSLGDVNMIKQE